MVLESVQHRTDKVVWPKRVAASRTRMHQAAHAAVLECCLTGLARSWPVRAAVCAECRVIPVLFLRVVVDELLDAGLDSAVLVGISSAVRCR